MKSTKQEPITIGLDIGSSTTKVVGYTQSGNWVGALQLDHREMAANAFDAVDEFLSKYQLKRADVARIAVTGVGSVGLMEQFEKVPVTIADEFLATAKGALFLAGIEKAIIVSMGTGTVLLRADGGEVRHLGGSGVGGGTLAGLCRYFYPVSGIEDIMAQMRAGDLDKVDLHIRDLVDDATYVLGGDVTASNFGKITKDATSADMMLGFANMIYETIGMMAAFTCANDSIKTVVLTGSLTALPQVSARFAAVQELTGVEFVIPENAVYATAIGAVLLSDAV